MAEKVYRSQDSSITIPASVDKVAASLGGLTQEMIERKETEDYKYKDYKCLQQHLSFLVRKKDKLNVDLQNVGDHSDKVSSKISYDIKKTEKEISEIHEYIYANYSMQDVEKMSKRLIAESN